MKVALVDLGTNTCRLYLGFVEGRAAVQHDRQTTVVRLGQGVDVTRRLHADAVARTRACLNGYAACIRAFAPGRVLLVTTSVLRDAGDGEIFLRSVNRDFGLPVRVLSGPEEAMLAFRGATAELAGKLSGQLALVDIGGGSTELAVGEAGQAPPFTRSCDIGAVRLTERFFAHDPPLPVEIAAAEALVAETIAAALPSAVRAGVRAAVGVAGTYTTLVAYKLGLRTYAPELVHGHMLRRDDIEAAIKALAGLTSAQRGQLAGIQPGRQDVILAGALIARTACMALGLESVRCSEADLLDGAALALADGSLTAS